MYSKQHLLFNNMYNQIFRDNLPTQEDIYNQLSVINCDRVKISNLIDT